MTDRVGFYRENGYVLVPGVFDDREVRAMRDGLDRILDAVSGTAHDRNHRWSAVGDSALTLKGFHDLPGFWGWRPRFRIRQAEFA